MPLKFAPNQSLKKPLRTIYDFSSSFSKYILTFTILLQANLLTSTAHAQQGLSESLGKDITINAQQIEAKNLPFPGETITLRAEVTNTRDFRLPIRLLAVRDGKFQEIAATSGLLGSNERPQYQIEIPAPLAELSYQFVLLLADGRVVSSKRYSVRRNCIPDTTPVEGELSKEVEGSDRFNQLLVDNFKLEQEIANLERAGKELDSVSELLAK